jgi:hypothetical protein
LPAGRRPADLEPDFAALRRKLDGVGQGLFFAFGRIVRGSIHVH